MAISLLLYTALLALATASPAPQYSCPPRPTVIAAPGTLAIGAQCSSSNQCTNGAACWAVSDCTVLTCGSFQAPCTSDAQCATNSCNQGFCNGPPPSPTPVATPTPAPTSSSSGPPSVTAAAGTLGLGAPCSTDAQCVNGAGCYGVTSFTIKTCGSFQAACQSDSQCATNTCIQGTCSGYLAPQSYRISTTAGSSALITASTVVSPVTSAPTTLKTATASSNSSTVATRTTAGCGCSQTSPASTTTKPSTPKFTGAAPKVVGGSCFAILGMLAAFAL